MLPEQSTAVSERPLLSIVAVSRNDDHGGDMRARMQHFIDGFIAQCDRHQLHAELILVEWNPPPDRTPLADSLNWTTGSGPAQIRIVTVPPAVHFGFPHASELPLFQMIGKNVGIRRARGTYVLATNVDILFNDALVQYMREALRPGIILRVDRYDVPSDLPKNASFEQILADCDRRFFYVNTRFGTFDMRMREMVGVGLGLRAQLLAALFETRMFGLHRGLRRVVRHLGHSLSHRVSAFPTQAAHLSRKIARLASMVRRREIRPLATLLYHFARAKWRTLETIDGLFFPHSLLTRWLQSSRWLHANACGDFTLLAREDWFRMRGYPEWPIHSWHLDSAFLYAAAAQGIMEVALGPQYRIYHIDHGSGWSPIAANQLFEGLAARGIPYLTNEDLSSWHDHVLSDPPSAIVNAANWGLADCRLDERQIIPPKREASGDTRGGAASLQLRTVR